MKGIITKLCTRGARLLLPALLLFSTCGCEDYVSVDPPTTQLTSETVFNDASTATAALLDVYAKLRESSLLTGRTSGLSALMGLYTDELTFYGSPSHFGAGYYNNNLLASDTQAASWWSNGYNVVYSANAIIEGLQRSEGIQQQDKELLTGEALLIRALVHFYLHNLYGDIPYITTTDYTANSRVGRMTSSEIHALLVEDLDQAYALLPQEYIAAGRTRVNKGVAKALLARVCLYAGDYAQAADAASAVLNNTALYQDAGTAVAFLKDSPATLWQFSPSAEGTNSYEGQSFIFTSGPPPFAALSAGLLGAFEPGDQRRVLWIAEVQGDGGPWYHSYKYRERFTDTSLEYSIVFRLPELYLIRSEARLAQGELIGAREDLNHIRNAAGLPDSEAMDAAGILAAIVQERRVEFFTEHGHRFFDLKRLGLLDTVLTVNKPGWQGNDALLPLPENDLRLNPNLEPQNPGY
ncbi:RagB/SusD family nutrient uptake outer membrane protein [Flavobacterium alkalisoli]|uniref:RagB/SusD family nutrient uptake outer membrane protein n=1 Tax=Flavobacterium alkalisoli TaxID=2602769 RepID=UPI003A8F5BBB